MILSMTGFGRGVASSSSKKITIEIKSLNSKQFDLTMRVPSYFKEIEVEARNYIGSRMERGKTDLSASVEYVGDETPVQINEAVVSNYKRQIEELGIRLGIGAPQDWFGVLMRMPDTLRSDVSGVGKDDIEAFHEACAAAVDALEEFRATEGRKLYDFFVGKIKNLGALLDGIEPYETERVPKIRALIEEQLSRLDSIEIDKGRLEQEMIFYIEKLDVTEEKTRLRTHLAYFLDTMGERQGDRAPQGQGKKLGFIAQEMGREINTLGSKSNHAEMQKIVVMMKDELEQIKEQVLNVL